METHTYQQIASDYHLWLAYVDTTCFDAREFFDSHSVQEKVAFLERCFGTEPVSE